MKTGEDAAPSAGAKAIPGTAGVLPSMPGTIKRQE
jgi:hypothetical protein